MLVSKRFMKPVRQQLLPSCEKKCIVVITVIFICASKLWSLTRTTTTGQVRKLLTWIMKSIATMHTSVADGQTRISSLVCRDQAEFADRNIMCHKKSVIQILFLLFWIIIYINLLGPVPPLVHWNLTTPPIPASLCT